MTYSIKMLIKEKNETLSTVANKLHLSRPTLDTYIILYERGEMLPKVFYQEIFDTLFSDYNISLEAFKERLDMCEEVILSDKKDVSIGLLSRRADRAAKLMKQLHQNISYEKFDEELYEFINLVITNYSDDTIYNLVQFFIMLYGKKDVSQASDFQIAYFAELYHAFDNLNRSEIHFDYRDWTKYREKCQRAKRYNEMGDIRIEREYINRKEEEIRRLLYGNKIWGMEF